MPSEEKIAQVDNLTAKLTKAKSVVLTEYHGLSVAKINELRGKLQEHSADFSVTKNTLLSRALKAAQYPKLPETLQGPTATLFAFEDEIAPIKSLAEFIKANELPSVKFGFLGKDLLSKEKVLELAKLPEYQELIAQMVGGLNAPIAGLVRVLQGNLRNLVYTLNAIAIKEGGD